jgi:hypothetical protein
LDYGADSNFQRGPEIDEGERSSIPAVVITMFLAKAQFLAELLNHGAVLNRAMLGHFYDSSLHTMLLLNPISREKKLTVCCTLVEHAKSNKTTRAFLHEALDVIVQENAPTYLEILLQAGITPRNQTIHDAVRRGRKSIIRLLVQYGVDPFQQQGASKTTSLFDTAAGKTNTKVFQPFLAHWDERFASNGGRNDDGDYPIHDVSYSKGISTSNQAVD